MNIEKNDLGKSQAELKIELTAEEFAPYIKKGAHKVSLEVKIDGFRPGHIPIDILKKKIGDMSILEEAARFAIDGTVDKAIADNIGNKVIGQPKIEVVKLAPDNPFIYKAVVAVLPEIKLGDYKNAKVKKTAIEIKDEEVNKITTDLREMKVKEVLVDREIKDDDKVLVDIQMFLDKVPLDAGQAKGTSIIIGKNYIIPGFDKKLIGAKKSEVREFSLPYPADFHMKNIAGKMVELKVTVNEVYERQLPPLDDELALSFGLKKADELLDNIKKSLLAQKEKEAEQVLEKEMLEKIVAATRFGDIPEMLVEHETHTMLHELEDTVMSQGAKFDDYLSSLNKTRDQLTLDLLPDAVKRVKVSLLIREVAVLEKITASEEEAAKQIAEMRKHYKDSPESLKQIDVPEYKSYVRNVLATRKVVDKLKEWNLENK